MYIIKKVTFLAKHPTQNESSFVFKVQIKKEQ